MKHLRIANILYSFQVNRCFYPSILRNPLIKLATHISKNIDQNQVILLDMLSLMIYN